MPLTRSRSTTTTRSGAAFNNRYWPAHYFIDADGIHPRPPLRRGQLRRVPAHHPRAAHGCRLQQHLPEPVSARLEAAGVQSARRRPQPSPSPETYLGYGRAENFASAGASARDQPADYAAPATAAPQPVGTRRPLVGGCRACTGRDRPAAASRSASARADLHLVLAPAKPLAGACGFARPLDGAAPGDDHGVDVDAHGMGRRRGALALPAHRPVRRGIRERTFSIEFLLARRRELLLSPTCSAQERHSCIGESFLGRSPAAVAAPACGDRPALGAASPAAAPYAGPVRHA